MSNPELKPGKRYEWPMEKPGTKKKNGLFTGEYGMHGAAILLTRNGERWSIPVEDLEEYKK